MGVIGMRLEEGDEVIGMQMASQGDTLLVVSENGMGKRTMISDFTLSTEVEREFSAIRLRKKQETSSALSW